jgi:putative membrane protein
MRGTLALDLKQSFKVTAQAMQRGSREYALLSLKGGLMGLADTVPGVSGGTVALVTGIYEELIKSLARIGPARLKDFRDAGMGGFWRSINGSFLLAVFGGLLVVVLTVAELMNWLLNHHRVLLWGFFFGLILASVPLVAVRMRHWRFGHIGWAGSGLLIGLGVTLMAPATTPDALWMIFLAGMIAISAMVLPGLSGSFLLLILAKYETMVQAVVERDLLVIAVFVAGAIVGMLGIARVLAALFRRHHDATIALLTGFMAGSLNALWPWQHGVGTGGFSAHFWPRHFEAVAGQSAQVMAVLAWFVVGVLVIAVFAWLERAHHRRVT